MKKRFLAWLLACVLCLTLLPAAALASEEPGIAEEAEQTADAEEITEDAAEPAEEAPAPAADGLTKLDAPTELTWHKKPVTNGSTGELDHWEDSLGELSWRFTGPVEALLMVEIFRVREDGSSEQVNLGSMWYSPGDRAYKSMNYADLFAEEGSGTYYFTVWAEDDSGTYAASDVARSENWTYTAPEGRLGEIKDLTLTRETISFTLPDEGPFGGYGIAFYRAATEDGEPVRATGFSYTMDPDELTPGTTVTEYVEDWIFDQCGGGWYYVIVQVYSGDINTIGNSPESELSNAIFVEGEIKPLPGEDDGDDEEGGPEAWVAGQERFVKWFNDSYEKNATPVLAVEAEGDEPLTYEWFAYEWRENTQEGFSYWYPLDTVILATGPSFTAPPVTEPAQYGCRVTDANGKSSTVNFELRVDNHFEASSENRYVSAPIGQNATMRVIASSDDPITYQWYTTALTEYGYNDTDKPIEGATGPELTVTVEKNAEYACMVTSGNTTIGLFVTVEVENGFTAYAKGTEETDTTIHVAEGKNAALEVDAHATDGTLTYQWYHEELTEAEWGTYYQYVPVAGADKASLTTSAVTEAEWYYCKVTDKYGSTREVYFTVFVEDGFTLTPVGSYTKVEEPHAPGVMTDYAVDVYCVYAKPGQEVTFEGMANGTDIQYSWWRYTESEDYSPVEEKTGRLIRTAEEGDVYYLLSAENAYGESDSLIFKIVVSGEGPAYDPLDVNRDGHVDAKDAAVFLREKNDPYSAALALRRAVELG